MSRRYGLAVLSCFVALACGDQGSESEPSGAPGRDSAGIRIIENPRPPDGSRLNWRIGAEPTLSIGESEGEEPYLLYFVYNALRLRDGRIVVGNGGSNELRFFDAMGNHVATRGGSGEGPGEFERLMKVEPWPGDSIVAWSAPRAGFAVFDSHGNYGRTFTLADDGSTPGFLWFPISATSDGGLLAMSG